MISPSTWPDSRHDPTLSPLPTLTQNCLHLHRIGWHILYTPFTIYIHLTTRTTNTSFSHHAFSYFGVMSERLWMAPGTQHHGVRGVSGKDIWCTRGFWESLGRTLDVPGDSSRPLPIQRLPGLRAISLLSLIFSRFSQPWARWKPRAYPNGLQHKEKKLGS